MLLSPAVASYGTPTPTANTSTGKRVLAKALE
jgi:hypothetical protein